MRKLVLCLVALGALFAESWCRAAGSYANNRSVSTSFMDPNPFNNTATATLAVTGPAFAETCVVPNSGARLRDSPAPC